MLNKRLGLALSLLVILGCVIVATRYISGQSNQPRKPISMTVLRGKDRIQNKPTALEIASFRAIQQTERELEDRIPKQVPIKVKVRSEKEKAFKDLKNGHWLRNFELEVTNTSDKPIYFLELWLMLPETKTENNRPLAFTLRYGRADFINPDTLPVAADVPIQPHETYTFILPEEQQQAWQKFKHRRKEADPKKVRLKFIQLNFGDGTGFNGGDALPYPYQRRQSSMGACREGPSQTPDKPASKRSQIPSRGLRAHSFLQTPAALLPVKFSVVEARIGNLKHRRCGHQLSRHRLYLCEGCYLSLCV